MNACDTLYVELPDRNLRELLSQFFCGLGIQLSFTGKPSRVLEYAKGPGFSADAIYISGPQTYVQYLSQTLDFTPNARLMVFYDRYLSYETTRSRLLQAAVYLLYNISWKLGLRLDGEKTVLLRRNDFAYLNSPLDVWTPQQLQMAARRYTIADLDMVTI
jgi:hypothetical protein